MLKQQKLSKSYLPNDIYMSAIQKIQQLTNLNNKLIIIADQISKINNTDVYKPHPTIIYQFQTDINNSFNALIENIQEYFIVLDQKLKQIGAFLQNKIHNQTERQYANSHLENLSYRIEALQKDLKRTQNNEAKLIKIVEQFTCKQKEEQPTIIKNKQFDYGMPENHYGSQSQNSFRLFSMMDKKKESLYPQPYLSTSLKSSEMQQSKHHQKFGFTKMCMPTINDYTVKSIGVGKRSLKGQIQPDMQSSNKQHRMAYMMKVLKQ